MRPTRSASIRSSQRCAKNPDDYRAREIVWVQLVLYSVDTMEWNILESDNTALAVCVKEILDTLTPAADRATVLTLTGDLGVGKTTFIQALALALGIMDSVTSPTFTIMKQYVPTHTFDTLVHIDAYRFENVAEAAPLHLTDVFMQPNTLVCIEWPERITAILPSTATTITMRLETDGARSITLTNPAS